MRLVIKRIDERIIMEKEIEANRKQRMDFVEYWANHVRNNEDWSIQHTKFINAMMKNKLNISKDEYLEVENEQRRIKKTFG